MLKVRNVSDWIKIEAGKALNFEKTNARAVRLECKSASPVAVDYVDPDGLTVFLGKVDGFEIIEFTTPGEFAIMASGDDLWIHTVDGEKAHFVFEDAVRFTKLMERRQRNPELERMQYLMHANMRAALEQQSAQMAALIDQRVAAAAAAAAQPAAAGNAGSAPVQSGSDAQPADGAGAASSDGGNGSGATAAA